jgi:nucleotidyltransferase/DNA polymerase involved in DNA repair
MTCKTVAVIAILSDLSIHTRSKMLESPSSDEKLIEEAAKQLIQQFLESNSEAVLRRVGVKVSSLKKETDQTNMSKFLAA